MLSVLQDTDRGFFFLIWKMSIWEDNTKSKEQTHTKHWQARNTWVCIGTDVSQGVFFAMQTSRLEICMSSWCTTNYQDQCAIGDSFKDCLCQTASASNWFLTRSLVCFVILVKAMDGKTYIWVLIGKLRHLNDGLFDQILLAVTLFCFYGGFLRRNEQKNAKIFRQIFTYHKMNLTSVN